jgi:cell division septal protein FtsQ
MVTMRQRVRRGGLFGRSGNRRVRARTVTPAEGTVAPVGSDAAEVAADEPAPDRPGLGARLRGAAAATGRGLGRAARATWRGLRVAARVACALVLATALGGGAWAGYRAIMTSPHFAVREVALPQVHHVSRDELLTVVAVEPGRNIFSVDLGRISRDLAAHPWLDRVAVRRELPNRIIVEASEREPALLVELSGLYLADREGHIFKRAEPEETAGLVVVTGIARESYLRDRPRAEASVRGALQVLETYAAGPGRPAVGELHLDEDGGVVLVTTEQGLALRLGQGDLPAKLQRFDVVWRALGPRQTLARAMYLDNRTRPDRVTLKLEPDAEGAPDDGEVAWDPDGLRPAGSVAGRPGNPRGVPRQIER